MAVDSPPSAPDSAASSSDVDSHVAASGSELFLAIFESIQAGLVVATLDGKIIEANERFSKMLGFKPGELHGYHFSQITHADDVERSQVSQGNAWAAGTGGYSFDKRYRRKDGTTCWARLTVSTVRNPDGSPSCNVGIVEDLTSRRVVERRLRFQGQLLDSVSDSVVATDLDGRVTFWGRGAETLYGYSSDQAMGELITFIVPPGSESDERERMQAVHEQGYWKGQYLQRRRDGSTFWADTFISLVRDERGEAIGYVGIDRDISDRVAGQAALRRSEEKFRMLAENIREVFWMSQLDEPATFFVSPAYEEIWGRSCESLYEDPYSFLEAVHAEDRASVEQTLSRQLAGENTVQVYRILRPDGSIRWIRDRGFPVIDDDGRVIRVVGIAEDVTETRAAGEKQRRLQARVEHTQRLESLGILAGGIAHDFNNLLTGIIGNAGLARSSVPPDSPLADNLSTIETASLRAAELTRLMLAYSGRAPLQPSDVDLSQVVEELGSLMHAALPGSTTVELDLASALPTVKADVAQIRQVVMNLFTNAGEAMPEDGGVISVKTGVRFADRDYLAATYVDDALAPGDYVFVEIRDRGCGMDEATLSRIFDPFFTTKFTGRGLGLAAVLGIVRAHQGAISFDSRPGEGTTVCVLFPPLPAVSDTDDTTGEAEQVAGRDETVLVVDDEALVRDTVVKLLRHHGYRVLEADCGERAIRVLTENPRHADTMLLDLTMPGLDGRETFRRIRAVAPDVRVFLCSGYSDVELEKRFADQGFAGFLRKPFGLSELLRVLST